MGINVNYLRWLVQHLGMLVFNYGGHVGLKLGSSIPCFSCPYVAACEGYCFLRVLQGSAGLAITLGTFSNAQLWNFLTLWLVFILLVALLGKLWCGWLCPFGLVQDWLTAIRVKMGIRERQIHPKVRPYLRPIKYLLLAYLLIIPPLITIGWLHTSFGRPFCSICPGRTILPLIFDWDLAMTLDLSNAVALGLTGTLLVLTGLMMVGMFFSKRFFCLFCPMLVLIHMIKPITLLKIHRNPSACIGCGNCRRSCPMNIDKISLKRDCAHAQTVECINCTRCIESCPSDGSISLKFGKFNLFSSSKAYVAKYGNK